MPRKVLLKSQTNDVFHMISLVGLDPTTFRWHEEVGENDLIVSKLVHITSNYFFLFDYHHMGHWSHFSPGKDLPEESVSSANWESRLTKAVSPWLESLKREIEAPDLWANLSSFNSFIETGVQEPENSKFSSQELIGISTTLNDIKRHLIELNSTSQLQRDQIDRRFEYLEQAAGRVGRIDWKNIFVSTLIACCIEKALVSQEIIEMSSFSWKMLKFLYLRSAELIGLGI